MRDLWQVTEAGWRDDECQGLPRFKIRADKPRPRRGSSFTLALTCSANTESLVGNASLGFESITDSLQIHGTEAGKTRYQELFRGSGREFRGEWL